MRQAAAESTAGPPPEGGTKLSPANRRAGDVSGRGGPAGGAEMSNQRCNTNRRQVG